MFSLSLSVSASAVKTRMPSWGEGGPGDGAGPSSKALRASSRCRPSELDSWEAAALGELGLLYQLQNFTAPDPDDCWEQDEVQTAADLLRAEPVESAAALEDDEEHSEPDEEDWEARDEARYLRERVLSTWRSGNQPQAAVTRFPWLAQRAEPKLAAKHQYLEVLRHQAALFVASEGLAAAAAMADPELPTEEVTFSAIGTDRSACGPLGAGQSTGRSAECADRGLCPAPRAGHARRVAGLCGGPGLGTWGCACGRLVVRCRVRRGTQPTCSGGVGPGAVARCAVEAGTPRRTAFRSRGRNRASPTWGVVRRSGRKLCQSCLTRS